jgi:hypothetical protein
MINNTWIYSGESACGNDESLNSCITSLGGGLFDSSNSTTFQAGPTNPITAGLDLFDTSLQNISGPVGYDTVSFGANTSLSGFPLRIASKGIDLSTNQVQLGLGSNSTLLAALKQTGRIASRTWSYWYGHAGGETSAQMDGQLVLGGYDSQKIKPEKKHVGEIAYTDQCYTGMTVTVSKMFLNFPNGSSPNIMDTDEAGGSGLMTACLCPTCPFFMALPLDPYFARYEEWTGSTSVGHSTGINFWTMLYEPDNVFQGDVTIELDSGLQVRVPNSQFVLPDMSIDKNTGEVTSNTTVRDVVFYSLQDSMRNLMPGLGRYFLTAAYLMVNHEETSFTLWEANPTTDEDVVPILDEQTKVACANNSATTESPATKTVDGDTSRPTSSATADGSIAGIVLGAFAVIGSITAFVFLIQRRRERRRLQRDPTLGDKDEVLVISELSGSTDRPREMYSGPPTELVGDVPPPSELWAGRQARNSRESSKSLYDVHEI